MPRGARTRRKRREPPELPIGHIVAGIHAIHSLLGRAGPTATYHAFTAPNREIALKLYDPALVLFGDVTRTLERYRGITGSLPSNLVLPIGESGRDEATQAPYSVTELHSTPSLAQLVELCPLSPSEMVSVVGNLARTLDLAHAGGMSHLSLKPTNLFIGPAPANEVRVADFGISLVRAVLPNPAARAACSPWLAPEQIKIRRLQLRRSTCSRPRSLLFSR